MSKLRVTDPASIANLARAATGGTADAAGPGAASAPAIDPVELEHEVRLTLGRERSSPADGQSESLHVDLDTGPHHP